MRSRPDARSNRSVATDAGSGTLLATRSPGGTPHVYFDDARASISGAPLNAGDTVELRRIPLATPDPGNDRIVVDLIDLENVASAPAMPTGHLSVASYRAVPDDGIDDTAAIVNCVAAAKAAGKGVWLPRAPTIRTPSSSSPT